MLFAGNPGTGKTTVARMAADLFFRMGVIKTNKLVIVKPSDMVSEWIGGTGTKAMEVIRRAYNGVLFIDEAYSLVNTEPNGQKFASEFDEEAYTEIMTFLEDLNKNYGITILFITHDMHLAIEYTDRALVFSDGKCISSDNVFKVLSDEEVIEKANLKQTSLYTLASRLGLSAQEFIRHFIETERRGRA
jgi:ABC-type multidrug transport system ATPase subunit